MTNPVRTATSELDICELDICGLGNCGLAISRLAPTAIETL